VSDEEVRAIIVMQPSFQRDGVFDPSDTSKYFAISG